MDKEKTMSWLKGCLLVLFILAAVSVQARENKDTPTGGEKKQSPFFITPLVSSDPKVSTSGGVLAGYIHQFDEKSPPSLFGVTGAYSTTDSWYTGVFGKTYFGRDNHRLTTVLAMGEIRNDYSDFLGSGQDVQTTDDLTMFGLRYVFRVFDRWYIGPQFISTNYAISGDNLLSGDILDEVGLVGFKSNGIGLIALYDSRDNQYSPSAGQFFQVFNTAYSEDLGGDVSFEAYTADYRHYLSHGRGGHVLALHAKGRWTNNAPSSGYSSVDVRGYTKGQYLAPHMTLVEFDERFALTEKFGLTAFAGLAVLYGHGSSDGSDSLFPAGGAGIYHQLNDNKMVVRADFAFGKEGNYGFYLKFGQPF